MQQETISASNTGSVTLTLSRSMAEFLFDVIGSEICDNPVDQKYDAKKLRRIGNVLHEYLKPTAKQRKLAMHKWIKRLNLGRFNAEALTTQKNRLQELV